MKGYEDMSAEELEIRIKDLKILTAQLMNILEKKKDAKRQTLIALDLLINKIKECEKVDYCNLQSEVETDISYVDYAEHHYATGWVNCNIQIRYKEI